MENQVLTPKLAKQIIADATSLGLAVEDYLESVIQTETNGVGERPFYETASTEEWTKALNELAEKSPQYAPPLSDEAISRESIYREGKIVSYDLPAGYEYPIKSFAKDTQLD